MSEYLLFMPGGTEIIVILIVVVLLFGGKKIPELMRGLGKGVKEFKSATSEVEQVKNDVTNTIKEVGEPKNGKVPFQENDQDQQNVNNA